MQAEIAVLRFGLGARPGDLAAAAADPRAWLKSQIQGAAPLAIEAPLAPSDQIFEALVAARDERQEMKRESAAKSADAQARTQRLSSMRCARPISLITAPRFWRAHKAPR